MRALLCVLLIAGFASASTAEESAPSAAQAEATARRFAALVTGSAEALPGDVVALDRVATRVFGRAFTEADAEERARITKRLGTHILFIARGLGEALSPASLDEVQVERPAEDRRAVALTFSRGDGDDTEPLRLRLHVGLVESSPRIVEAESLSGVASRFAGTKLAPVVYLDRIEKLASDEVAQAVDDLRSIFLFLMVRVTTGGWKHWRFNGRSFVLGPVADGDIDIASADGRSLLFSPATPEALENVTGESYEDVTRDALKEDGRFSALTTYAGRRNADRDYMITPSLEMQGTPILADLNIEGVVVIAFSNGEVKAFLPESIGFAPGERVVVGDDSPSELLRPLSNR